LSEFNYVVSTRAIDQPFHLVILTQPEFEKQPTAGLEIFQSLLGQSQLDVDSEGPPIEGCYRFFF
jgi:hypothetical protein